MNDLPRREDRGVISVKVFACVAKTFFGVAEGQGDGLVLPIWMREKRSQQH